MLLSCSNSKHRISYCTPHCQITFFSPVLKIGRYLVPFPFKFKNQVINTAQNNFLSLKIKKKSVL